MLRQRIARRCTAAMVMAVVAVILVGCSSGRMSLDPTEWFPKQDPDARSVTGAEGGFTVTRGGSDEPVQRAVTQSDLVGADGRCEGASSEPAASAPRGGALAMTECQLVTVAGVPDQVNVSAEAGDRRVVLTYSKGDHPGIYTFVAGRLKIIERLPTPPKPEPRRRAPKKQRA
ncbi:MAG: hypothetical protein GEU91_13620 [Rhizobiales bacterium]|nr:hypothetical protein [Hyphomicrobiales bacterium]